jgi:SAM-dependent methyltransferase
MKITAGSILRMLQYRSLASLSISGRILDLGGSTKSGYHEFFSDHSIIDTLNIDSKTGANIVGSVEEPLPLESSTYDYVLAINLIEHVYKVGNVFRESERVLKSKGKFVVMVPFFHHIHGSPDDYHRYTASSLRRMAEDVDLEIIEIRELGGGLFSTWFQMLGGAIKPRVLRDLVKDFSAATDSFLSSISKGYARMVKNNPLGYLMIAIKK